MKRYEIIIYISDEKYVDRLIASLVRQGYGVYYNEEEKTVCYTASEDGVQEIAGE